MRPSSPPDNTLSAGSRKDSVNDSGLDSPIFEIPGLQVFEEEEEACDYGKLNQPVKEAQDAFIEKLTKRLNSLQEGEIFTVELDMEGCFLNGQLAGILPNEYFPINTDIAINQQLLASLQTIKEKVKAKGGVFLLNICSTANLADGLKSSEGAHDLQERQDVIIGPLLELNDNKPIIQLCHATDVGTNTGFRGVTIFSRDEGAEAGAGTQPPLAVKCEQIAPSAAIAQKLPWREGGESDFSTDQVLHKPKAIEFMAELRVIAKKIREIANGSDEDKKTTIKTALGLTDDDDAKLKELVKPENIAKLQEKLVTIYCTNQASFSHIKDEAGLGLAELLRKAAKKPLSDTLFADNNPDYFALAAVVGAAGGSQKSIADYFSSEPEEGRPLGLLVVSNLVIGNVSTDGKVLSDQKLALPYETFDCADNEEQTIALKEIPASFAAFNQFYPCNFNDAEAEARKPIALDKNFKEKILGIDVALARTVDPGYSPPPTPPPSPIPVPPPPPSPPAPTPTPTDPEVQAFQTLETAKTAVGEVIAALDNVSESKSLKELVKESRSDNKSKIKTAFMQEVEEQGKLGVASDSSQTTKFHPSVPYYGIGAKVEIVDAGASISPRFTLKITKPYDGCDVNLKEGAIITAITGADGKMQIIDQLVAGKKSEDERLAAIAQLVRNPASADIKLKIKEVGNTEDEKEVEIKKSIYITDNFKNSTNTQSFGSTSVPSASGTSSAVSNGAKYDPKKHGVTKGVLDVATEEMSKTSVTSCTLGTNGLGR